MGDLFTWLISFFFLILLLGILGYQLICLIDLEFDYINPYDSASQINKFVLPEFFTQGILSFCHLIAGHWFMFLMSLPYLYYNVRFGLFQLPWEKKQRIFKLFYLMILITASIFWMIWSMGDEIE